MSDNARLRTCTVCAKEKSEEEFYKYRGQPRGECKKCTVRRAVHYQRKVKAWETRCGDHESSKKYMREYYAKNKEKFVEYARRWKEKNPDYFKRQNRREREKEGRDW